MAGRPAGFKENARPHRIFAHPTRPGIIPLSTDPISHKGTRMPDPIPPTAQEIKAAFKAFKRRLKVTRLEAESKLGGGPLSGGSTAKIVAIMPPHEFPPAVWDELVRQGKLKKAGGGTYEVVGE
jgi:hypothetical protein